MSIGSLVVVYICRAIYLVTNGIDSTETMKIRCSHKCQLQRP